MTEHTLTKCRIMVVEDEYMLADELRSELEEAGAIVLGPVGRLSEALTIVDGDSQIDGAILDVNLGGESIFAAADRLLDRGVPFLFTTGYDRDAIPPRYNQILVCEKPMDFCKVAQAIGRLIHT